MRIMGIVRRRLVLDLAITVRRIAFIRLVLARIAVLLAVQNEGPCAVKALDFLLIF